MSSRLLRCKPDLLNFPGVLNLIELTLKTGSIRTHNFLIGFSTADRMFSDAEGSPSISDHKDSTASDRISFSEPSQDLKSVSLAAISASSVLHRNSGSGDEIQRSSRPIHHRSTSNKISPHLVLGKRQ